MPRKVWYPRSWAIRYDFRPKVLRTRGTKQEYKGHRDSWKAFTDSLKIIKE